MILSDFDDHIRSLFRNENSQFLATDMCNYCRGKVALTEFSSNWFVICNSAQLLLAANFYG